MMAAMSDIHKSLATIAADTGPASDPGRSQRHLMLIAQAAAGLLAADDAITMIDELFALIRSELRLEMVLDYRSAEGRLVLAAYGGLTAAQAEAGAMLDLVGESEDPQLDFVRELGVDSYAGMPLLYGEERLGMLGFGRSTGQFDAGEVRFLQTICGYVALAKHRLRIETALREDVGRHERSLTEVSHRARNALQTAIGLVAADAGGAADPVTRAALTLAAERLQVLAIAHRPLYATDRSDMVDFGKMLAAVVEQAVSTPVDVEAGGTAGLPVERGVAFALLIHALLLRPGEGPPTVVRLGIAADALLVTIEGPGRGAAAARTGEPRMVTALVRQVRATITTPDRNRLMVSIPYVRADP